ncbi:hypothetical protein ASPWEDRAFT_55556 [Aspergillus wentii DTO 134E9]|uniref:BTB domain-containing protein n=1 Tax=Aspergillus wentii DTO 134E9 TaxID=1073089 RepID=A0A1L9R3U9_ASPWE|nr:uncharacterized protein ASPWEDRAFT_55556 [Aspergillus wentii DTO 134E9]OJJ29601.1 hypothetical protein ASPWEDRAFT_55556 [Aspergillus wentii DTO 134E9]
MVKKNRKAVRSFVADDQEPEPPSPEQDMDSRRPILDLVSSLHLNSDYSDLVIIYGGKTFPAHKLVVCPRSEYFKQACFGGFKEETVVNNISEPALNELESEVATNENVIPSLECTEPGLVGGPLEKVPSDLMESIVNPLGGCHPCYIHMCIFGEADYLMIIDLKDRAKEQFCESLSGCYGRKFFAEIIKELYSDRANYQILRKLAINVVIDHLPNLWKRFAPAIDIELMKAVPDFSIDLCLATLDNYMVEPSNMKLYPFPTDFEYRGVDYECKAWDTTNWSYQN